MVIVIIIFSPFPLVRRLAPFSLSLCPLPRNSIAAMHPVSCAAIPSPPFSFCKSTPPPSSLPFIFCFNKKKDGLFAAPLFSVLKNPSRTPQLLRHLQHPLPVHPLLLAPSILPLPSANLNVPFRTLSANPSANSISINRVAASISRFSLTIPMMYYPFRVDSHLNTIMPTITNRNNAPAHISPFCHHLNGFSTSTVSV